MSDLYYDMRPHEILLCAECAAVIVGQPSTTWDFVEVREHDRDPESSECDVCGADGATVEALGYRY